MFGFRHEKRLVYQEVEHVGPTDLRVHPLYIKVFIREAAKKILKFFFNGRTNKIVGGVEGRYGFNCKDIKKYFFCGFPNRLYTIIDHLSCII